MLGMYLVLVAASELDGGLKIDYPKCTPLLVKILESLLSMSNIEDKIHNYEEVSFMTSRFWHESIDDSLESAWESVFLMFVPLCVVLCFASIYKSYVDMQRAIDEGNSKRIDGHLIKKSDNIIDGRTYKKVLVGQKVTGIDEQSLKQGDDQILQSMPTQNVVEDSSDMENGNLCLHPKKVKYDFELSKSDIEWLVRSAIGRCDGSVHYLDIQTILSKNVINCCISPMIGVIVLVTISSKKEMLCCLATHKNIFDDCFDHIEPWSVATVQAEVAY
ncbi:hypothetical protein REPUB_Repub01dG0051500 [Reevesia pubescens]